MDALCGGLTYDEDHEQFSPSKNKRIKLVHSKNPQPKPQQLPWTNENGKILYITMYKLALVNGVHLKIALKHVFR